MNHAASTNTPSNTKPKQENDMNANQQNRDEAIASEYNDNGFSTYDSIGQKYGLTRERVRQIIGKTLSQTPEEIAETRRQHVLRTNLAKATELVEADDSITSISALCDAASFSLGFVSDHAAELSEVIEEVSARRRQHRLDSPRVAVRKYNDDDIIATLRRMSASRGGQPITVTTYLNDRREDEPSISLIHLRMKSLIEACALAGVASGAPRERRAKFDKGDLIESIERCATSHGFSSVNQLSYLQYSNWAKTAGEPSGSLVRLNFGSWKNAKNNALKSLV